MQMHEQMIVEGQEQPISRTYQYRKVSIGHLTIVEKPPKKKPNSNHQKYDI